VAGVWVGNSDNKVMKGKADGSVLAAPIWHDFMAKILGDTPIETFKAPDDYKTGKPILDGQIPTEIIPVDISTGLPASSSTPFELIGEKIGPAYHDILYYVDKNDPLGPATGDPSSDPQFDIWEKAVKKWAEENASSTPINSDPLASTNKPLIKIISPLVNQIISSDNLAIQIEVLAAKDISRIEYYLNNNLWRTAAQTTPISQSVNFLNNGYHALKAVVCDSTENCGETAVNFNLNIKNNPVNPGKGSLKIINPPSGASLKANSFPLSIKLDIGQPTRTASINVFVKNISNGTLTNLKDINNPSSPMEIFWETPPPIGNYLLYARLNDWNGDITKSNEIELNMK